MAWNDPEIVGVAVRATARVSGTILMTVIVLRALAVRAAADGTIWARRARRALWIFVVAHTVHFATVLWLAWVTDGANIGGGREWPIVPTVAFTFYASVAWLLRRYRTTPAISGGEFTVTLIAWIVFAQAFAFRTYESPRFAPLAAFALIAMSLYISTWRAVRRARTPSQTAVNPPAAF